MEPDLDGVLAAVRWVLELDLGPDDDFFAAGGDSVKAAQLMVELQERYGRRLPESAVVEHPTARGLLGELLRPAPPLVVPLQTSGTRPPLLVVFGASGYVFGAQRLAGLLGSEQPVLALQPPDDAAARVTRVLPADAVQELEGAWPGRRWQVLGLGGAAFAAHDLTSRLELAGHTVSSLALVDAVPWPLGVAVGAVRARLLVLHPEQDTRSREWEHLTASTVRLVAVPGVPGRLLHEPGVRVVARQLALADLAG